MRSIISNLLTLLALFLPLSFSYPNCNPALYGTPPYEDCKDIFFSRRGNRGLESLDKKGHFFGAIGNPSRRPADVKRKEWERRVDLPRGWHTGECSALLSPNLHADGQPMYDIGTYGSIASVAQEIQMACMGHMTAVIGLMDGGSLDGAGDHHRLTLILYHPRSHFADAVRADVTAGRIMDYGAINLAGPADTNTNPYLDPVQEAPEQPGRPEKNPDGDEVGPSSRQRPTGSAQCGRRPYCSRHNQCSTRDCKCVADAKIDYWSTSCRAPFADAASAAGRGLLESSTNASMPSSALSNHTTEAEMIGRYLSNLACPCNCTYVSRKCCASASGIVHEQPQMHLGAVRAPSPDFVCDVTTGDWKETAATVKNQTFGGGNE